MQFYAISDVGKRRRRNEDSVLADPQSGLFIVADGVGGRAAGDIASRLTVDTFQESAAQLQRVVLRYAAEPGFQTRSDVLDYLGSLCQLSSRKVYEEAMRRDRPGMSTTLVAAAVGGGAAFLAHAGDSRAYLVRDGVMRQLTEDHSMVNEMIRSGRMTHEEARASKYRSVITRAVGQYPTVQADLMVVEILAGDRLVLCSDGLTDPVPVELIEEIAGRGELDTAGTALIQAALERGGPDNVSVILVEPEASQQSEAIRARASVLERLFLFEGLPFHAQMRVSAICQEVFFSPGDILVEQGEPGDSMYVIVQGRVKVERDGVLLAHLDKGQHFGEVALVDLQPRSARVQCEAFGSAIIISREQLQDFCRRDPALGNLLLWKLMQALGGRLRDANQLVAAASHRQAPPDTLSEADTTETERVADVADD